MFTLVIVLFITLVSLIVLLWVGTFLLQGYIYTNRREAWPGKPP